MDCFSSQQTLPQRTVTMTMTCWSDDTFFTPKFTLPYIHAQTQLILI